MAATALVYASISGFGSTGPARDWPGVDQIAQGHAGLMGLTGSDQRTRVTSLTEMETQIRPEVHKWIRSARQAGVKQED